MNYTTTEQSKKLVELGLNPDTADMAIVKDNTYCNALSAFNGVTLCQNYNEIKDKANYIPCWSLGALLEVMPPYLFEWERGIDLNIYRNLNGKGWHASYMPNNIIDMQKDKFRQITNGNTPLEAAYSMVIWLLENGYIKTEK